MPQSEKRDKLQLNVLIDANTFQIWNRILKEEKVFGKTKGDILEEMFTFHENNPNPAPQGKNVLRDERTQILARLKEVSAERVRLQIALKTINAELFLMKKGQPDALLNASLSAEVNEHWRDIIDSNPNKNQDDILRDIILNYASVFTVSELAKMDINEKAASDDLREKLTALSAATKPKKKPLKNK
jgi:hypothetical protein